MSNHRNLFFSECLNSAFLFSFKKYLFMFLDIYIYHPPEIFLCKCCAAIIPDGIFFSADHWHWWSSNDEIKLPGVSRSEAWQDTDLIIFLWYFSSNISFLTALKQINTQRTSFNLLFVYKKKNTMSFLIPLTDCPQWARPYP